MLMTMQSLKFCYLFVLLSLYQTALTQVEDMLIVNKDRLFLENVGAVKELSKVKFKIGI